MLEMRDQASSWLVPVGYYLTSLHLFITRLPEPLKKIDILSTVPTSKNLLSKSFLYFHMQSLIYSKPVSELYLPHNYSCILSDILTLPVPVY